MATRAQMLKIGLRDGCKLSDSYANSRNNYKVVEEGHILGFLISGGGRGAAAGITPIYRADIHIKEKKLWHIVSSYEVGERLNGYSFHDDYEGCTFATIAWNSTNALVNRADMKKLIEEAEKRTKRAKRKAKK